jgi:hypothetical protein
VEVAHAHGAVADPDVLGVVVGDREDNPADEADDVAVAYGDHKEDLHGRAIQAVDVVEVLAEPNNQEEREVLLFLLVTLVAENDEDAGEAHTRDSCLRTDDDGCRKEKEDNHREHLGEEALECRRKKPWSVECFVRSCSSEQLTSHFKLMACGVFILHTSTTKTKPRASCLPAVLVLLASTCSFTVVSSTLATASDNNQGTTDV